MENIAGIRFCAIAHRGNSLTVGCITAWLLTQKRDANKKPNLKRPDYTESQITQLAR